MEDDIIITYATLALTIRMDEDGDIIITRHGV